MNAWRRSPQVLVVSCDWRGHEAPEALLGRCERICAAALPEPARRQEWVRARLTAKAAVRSVTAGASVQIVADADGAPRVAAAAHVPPVSVSLSHTGSIVACATMRALAPLGVDVEPVDPRNDVFLRRVMAPGEDTVLAAGRPGLRATSLVSCKEAAVKAYGRPSVRLRDYHLLRGVGGSVWVRVDGTVLPRLRVWRECSRGLVTAICAPPGARLVRRRLTPGQVLRALADPARRPKAEPVPLT